MTKSLTTTLQRILRESAPRAGEIHADRQRRERAAREQANADFERRGTEYRRRAYPDAEKVWAWVAELGAVGLLAEIGRAIEALGARGEPVILALDGASVYERVRVRLGTRVAPSLVIERIEGKASWAHVESTRVETAEALAEHGANVVAALVAGIRGGACVRAIEEELRRAEREALS